MLDQKTFLQGIKYLKANYLNWSFNINDDLMLKVWYKKFSNLETNVFMALIEKYTEESKYPPTSPADVLNLIKQQFSSGAEAWEWLISLNKQYPLDNDYQKPKFYQELKKDAIAFNLFEMLELETIFTMTDIELNVFDNGLVKYLGFGLNYRKDKFVQWYDGFNNPQQALLIQNNGQLLLQR